MILLFANGDGALSNPDTAWRREFHQTEDRYPIFGRRNVSGVRGTDAAEDDGTVEFRLFAIIVAIFTLTLLADISCSSSTLQLEYVV